MIILIKKINFSKVRAYNGLKLTYVQSLSIMFIGYHLLDKTLYNVLFMIAYYTMDYI